MNSKCRINLSGWIIFLLSAAVMVLAARGDLWLDEIWSLNFAREAKSAREVFFRFHHDNNHPLNTLYLYALGEQRHLILYRLLAVFAGMGSVLLAGHVAERDWGKPEALLSMILTGFSYPMLLYFSEARGYAPAMLFGLLAYAVLGGGWRMSNGEFCMRVAGYWFCCFSGILSHATFILLIPAFLVWQLVRDLLRRETFWPRVRRMTVMQGPPLIFFTGWYLFFLKDMTVGGGPRYSVETVTGRAAALALSLPDFPECRLTALVLLLLLVGFGSLILYRQHDSRWSFFFAALLVFPLLMLLLSSPQFLYFRYFIVCFPFFYLLLARLAVSGWRQTPKFWRWLIPGMLFLWFSGQIVRDVRLIRYGRGDYRGALREIAAQSPARNVTLGSDHDFRNRMLFDFYAPRVIGGDRLHYVERSKWKDQPPDWILTHRQDPGYRPAKEIGIREEPNKNYRLVRSFRFSGISGWNWYIYRRSQ